MLKVQKLNVNAKLPIKAHDGDAGFDLFALEDCIVPSDSCKLVRTGLAVEIPYSFYGDITGKSGLTAKTNLRINRGIIDFGYTGEVMINCETNDSNYYEIKKGQKVAQLILTPCSPNDDVEEVSKVRSSNGRNTGGFGSTSGIMREGY